jgi:hypothetical protein
MFKKIKRLFSKKEPFESLPPERISMLLDMLARTEPLEVSCDDVSTALAEFSEMHKRGEDVTHLMPLVHQHLGMCPECREEFEAVKAAIEAEQQLD